MIRKVLLLCRLEQFVASCGGHRDHGRKLVARCREDELHARRNSRGNEPVPINGHSDHPVSGHVECVERAEKPGVLHSDRQAEFGEERTKYRQGVLCAEGDEDLIVFGYDPACAEQPLAKLFDQIGTVALN